MSETTVSVVATGYKPKGHEDSIGGVRTYITGPEDSKIGVVDLYDVLGFADETKQGADIVAEALNAVVIIPDVLKGMYAQPDWFPLDSDAKRQHFFGWLHGPAAAHKYLGILTEVMEECKTRFPSVTNWGSYGLCWGGKVIALSSKSETPFIASAQVHPGMLDPADAKEITIPHIVLASKDEPADNVAGFKEVIEGNGIGGFVTTYPTMHHGWLGSSADLLNEECFNVYTQGYTQLIEFFREHLPME